MKALIFLLGTILGTLLHLSQAYPGVKSRNGHGISGRILRYTGMSKTEEPLGKEAHFKYSRKILKHTIISIVFSMLI